MSIITEEYSVNLTLGNSYPTRLRLVQNDNGRLFKFTLYNGATQYIPDTETTAVTFEGTCADGSGYTLDCTINSNGTVQVCPTKKVTGVAGKGWARIVVTKADRLIGSAEFDVVVERAGYDHTTPTPTPVPPSEYYTKSEIDSKFEPVDALFSTKEYNSIKDKVSIGNFGVYTTLSDGRKRIKHMSNDATSISFYCDHNTNYDVFVNSADNNRMVICGYKGKNDLIPTGDKSIDAYLIYTGAQTDHTASFNSGDYDTIYIYLHNSSFKPSMDFDIKTFVEKTGEIDNIKNSVEAIREKANGYSFVPWKGIAEESGSTIARYTYAQLLENVYEPLRAKYPNYITRSVIGRDATNTYDIYEYTFEPDYYEQVCYLQSGVHGRETDAWVGLARLIGHICDDWADDDDLAYIRWNVKMHVVPVVNVWNISQSSRTDYNANGVNLNRDLIDKSQAETIAVSGYIDSIAAAEPISFAIDFHTTVNDSYGDYMLSVWNGEKNEIVAKRVVYMLARKNSAARLSTYLTKYNLGVNDIRLNNVGESTNTGTYVWYFKEKGISGATVEHSDYVWDNGINTAVTQTKCMENFGNQLIQHCKAKFKMVE